MSGAPFLTHDTMMVERYSSVEYTLCWEEYQEIFCTIN